MPRSGTISFWEDNIRLCQYFSWLCHLEKTAHLGLWVPRGRKRYRLLCIWSNFQAPLLHHPQFSLGLSLSPLLYFPTSYYFHLPSSLSLHYPLCIILIDWRFPCDMNHRLYVTITWLVLNAKGIFFLKTSNLQFPQKNFQISLNFMQFLHITCSFNVAYAQVLQDLFCQRDFRVSMTHV